VTNGFLILLCSWTKEENLGHDVVSKWTVPLSQLSARFGLFPRQGPQAFLWSEPIATRSLESKILQSDKHVVSHSA
jgi:hypothetical protein